MKRCKAGENTASVSLSLCGQADLLVACIEWMLSRLFVLCDRMLD